MVVAVESVVEREAVREPAVMRPSKLKRKE
jgi:hypothetical protein